MRYISRVADHEMRRFCLQVAEAALQGAAQVDSASATIPKSNGCDIKCYIGDELGHTAHFNLQLWLRPRRVLIASV